MWWVVMGFYARRMVDFAAGPVPGDLDVHWNHGVGRGSDATEPPIQVHAFDPHTFLLRQSKTVSFEAPFLFLLFGNDRALLLDTGATAEPEKFPLRTTVDELIARWLVEHPHGAYPLVVAHTHGHGDHVAGDPQFADRPDTTVVGHEPAQVQEFFGFADWPAEVVRFDLGGRVLDVTGIPGHQPASIAIYDPWSGFLLTGDTVLPGRVYGNDMPALVASLDRLVDFAEQRDVRHVVGCHVEMSRTPGRDYPMGARYQPDEAALPMSVDQLRAVRDAAYAATKPGVHMHDDFIMVNLTGPLAMVKLIARTFRQRLSR
jgi:hydroxyacylglutathione hydrolase